MYPPPLSNFKRGAPPKIWGGPPIVISKLQKIGGGPPIFFLFFHLLSSLFHNFGVVPPYFWKRKLTYYFWGAPPIKLGLNSMYGGGPPSYGGAPHLFQIWNKTWWGPPRPPKHFFFYVFMGAPPFFLKSENLKIVHFYKFEHGFF